MRFRARKTLWVSLGVLLLVLALLGNWLLNTGRLQPWIQARALETYLHLIAPKLPFKIESVTLDRNWSQLVQGKISSFGVVLEHQGWRAHLKGPLQFKTPDNLFTGAIGVQFQPKIELEFEKSKSPPLDGALDLTFEPKSLSLTELHIQLHNKHWNWKRFGVDLAPSQLELNWKDQLASLSLKAGTLQYEAKEGAANLNSLDLKASAPLTLQPFSVMQGGALQVDLHAGDSEILWNQFYADLPLSEFPFHLEVNDPLQFELAVADNLLKISAKQPNTQAAPSVWQVGIQTQKINLPHWMQRLKKALPSHAKFFNSIELKSGTLYLNAQTQFSWPLNLKKNPPRLAIQRFELANLSFRWPSQFFALHGFHLLIPEQERTHTGRPSGHHEGIISAETIAFKRVRAHLSPTSIEADGLSLEDFSAKTHQKITLGGLSPLALSFDHIPLEMGKIVVEFKEEPELWTSLKLSPVDLTTLTSQFCVELPKLPPAPISAQFSKLEISPSVFSPIGKIQLDLLGGQITVEELGGFDLGSEVPEIDFTARMKGIRLDELGKFLNFGEMDGILQGVAEDVTFLSWLPTRYQFRVEAKPLHHNDVVFSPEAMKNFVRLFAGGDIDYLPGVFGSALEWWVFGWPRRVLGGYDIDYAGVQVDSRDGVIILQTLDPPSVLARYKKHFILFGGHSFNIPLNSARYPVVMDATAMNNFLKHMSLQLASLKEDSREIPKTQCLPPN